jgi:bifunctional DNA-binding transcriptional regulator/antitoxin component of YhaV-PrlF toxin-antitoxin module
VAEILVQMGKRGTLVVPAKIRKRLDLEDGCYMSITEREDCIEFRKVKFGSGVNSDASKGPSKDGKRALAASILSGATNLGEYLAAIEEVRRMGLEPEEIPHERFGL